MSILQIKGGSFNEETHEYFDESGRLIPSTTQVLDSVGLVDYDAVPGKTLERKRQIGDAVHYAARLYIQNDLDWSTVQSEWAGYLMGVLNFIEENEFEAEAVEQSGIYVANGMPMAYTWDLLGKMKGLKHRVLVELKCAYREEPSWKYQLAAYEMTIPKSKDEYIVRMAIQLKKGGGYKPYLYENPRDRDRFMWALGVVYTKISDGLDWKKVKWEPGPNAVEEETEAIV